MTTKNSQQKIQEFQFHDIPKTTKWENFQRSIYDSDKEEFLGRTKKSWYQLFIFYAIFYACLALLFTICTRGLLATLNDKEPKWQLHESLIGTNPGLGFRPISDDTSEGSLIWYNLKEPETSQKWITLADKFLAPYNVPQTGKNYQNCTFGSPVKEGNVCTVNVDRFGPCSPSNKYGFNTGSPCVFLKLNRIFGWVPDYITNATGDLPEGVRTAIESTTSLNHTQVWVSCQGENSFDKERVEGFRYFPNDGFPGYYFPYRNYENYLSPLIAVQILNVLPNAIVNIECRAWAKNIHYSGNNNEREGSVHFEILVD